MNPKRQFKFSLTFRIGVVIVSTEIVVLAVIGSLFISQFSEQVDERLGDRIQTPGSLIAEGMLDYVAVSNPSMMSRLVGQEVTEW